MRAGLLLPALLLALPVAREAQTPTAGETVVRGIVFDSLTMRPLAAATVQIAAATGTSWIRVLETDSSGTFEFTGVPTGTYLIGFFHAEFDELGLVPPTFRIDVRAGPPIHVGLAIPSARSIALSLCGVNAVSDSTGLFLGYVRGADDSMPRPDAKLVLRWVDFVIRKKSIGREVSTIEASSGPSGLAAACGVPLGTPILVQAASADDSSGAFEITLPSSGLYHRDVFVAPLRRTLVATTDSLPAVALLSGAGRVRGRVMGATGRPISDATVTVWGTAVETVTNQSGEFALGNLPGGTHTLEARALGFAPSRQPVDIVSGTAGDAAVELTNLGIMLDTIRVVSQRVFTRGLADFERRKRMGFGRFFDEAEIGRRNPIVLTDLLRALSGVYVVPGQSGGDDVLMRGDRGTCRPDLVIDGVRHVNDATFPVNTLVWASQLRAVEVYSRSTSVPMEFQSMTGCGAIVVWTGARR
ncbi:MAG TPA: carboxypeptidase-like regulatory domain-containing protein [Gemmatimonadaceae bacterium]|nr:carboxypeptidase-like regulatory domain-containing protein [Gemmatimonadaceae bacterium]